MNLTRSKMSTFDELKEGAEASIAKLKSLLSRIQAGSKDDRKGADLESARLLKGHFSLHMLPTHDAPLLLYYQCALRTTSLEDAPPTSHCVSRGTDIERSIKSMENEARGSAPSQRRGQQDRISEVRLHASASSANAPMLWPIRIFITGSHFEYLHWLWTPPPFAITHTTTLFR